MALLWLAWVLLVVGIIAFISLIIYTEYGRDVSIPFSTVMIIIASITLGFSIHLFLL